MGTSGLEHNNITSSTIKACESFHRHFSDLFYRAHPTVVELIDKLKEVQTISYVKINTMNNPARQPPMRAARKLMEHLKTDYENGTIIRKEYVNGMATRNLTTVL